MLITILIKLEEDLAMKPLHNAFFGLLQYTSQLQDMIKSGKVAEREYRKWPLEIGWEHLQAVLPPNTKHAKFMANYDAKKRSVELVIPYCKEPAKRTATASYSFSSRPINQGNKQLQKSGANDSS